MKTIDTIQKNIKQLVRAYRNRFVDIETRLIDSHISFLDGEIERLEGEKRKQPLKEHRNGWTEYKKMETYYKIKGYNQAIQDQIDHYKEARKLLIKMK